jgi:translation initiation factor 3 subunit J
MDDDWDADDFTPLPPVLAKDEPTVKGQWDDEDIEEEAKEEEKPKPVRYYVFEL